MAIELRIRTRATGVDSASKPGSPGSDRGAVLPLVLVMVVIGALIVLPLMSYATSVLKANTVLSAKTQRFEAVKAGLRTALYDPLDLYRDCDQSQAAPTDYSSTTINGVDVDTSCQLVGFAKTVIDDHLRYGIAATEVGGTIPVELKGKKYTSPADNANDWTTLTTSSLEDSPHESRPNTIWLPDLPAYAMITRTRVQGYDMPAAYNRDGQVCKVYFPGKYVDDVVLTGPTFFTSGIYYFEGEVRVEGGADVVVGDGRYTGCATSQEAVFFSEPTLPPTEPHSITGFGATWVFGSDGRLVVSNANGRKLDLLFNRRYVDDRTSDPSLFVSIASVNGEVKLDGSHADLDVPGLLSVPRSRVLTAKDTYQTPQENHMVPSSLTATPRPPAAPVSVTATPFRTSSSTGTATNGGVYLTWTAPPVEQQNGAPIHTYQVFVRGEATPRCTVQVVAVAVGLPYECVITGLNGTSSGVEHNVDVLALNDRGASSATTATFTIKNGTSGSPAQTGQHTTLNAPSGTPATTVYNGAVRVSWTAPTYNNPRTPITGYTVTAKVQGTPTLPDRTCTTTTRTATSCIVTGLTNARNWRFTVTATNLLGTTSSASTSTGNVQPTSGSPAAPSPDPNNPVPVMQTLPVVPTVQAVPIVDIDLSHTTNAAPASVRIPGYIAVPQGTVAIDNTPAHRLQLIGGMLAARYDVVDGRATGAACTTPPSPLPPGWAAGVNCVDLGFESEVVQMRLRIVSTTPSGHEKSVAIVQVNENGAYAVNSWEVQ